MVRGHLWRVDGHIIKLVLMAKMREKTPAGTYSMREGSIIKDLAKLQNGAHEVLAR